MKENYGTIQYKEKEYKLVFNINVMQAIQEEYGTLDAWADLTDGTIKEEPDAKAVIFGFTEMLNEGIDIDNEENGTDNKPLSHKQVGRIISEVGMIEATKKMNETAIDSTKSDDDSKNE